MFPQIQRQLKVIQKTLSTVSSLIALITLFLLIFAILGMNLFGNRAICELDSEDVGAHQTVFGCVWQCVAVCCGVLQCVAVCCSVLQGVCAEIYEIDWEDIGALAVRCSVLQCVAVCYSVMQFVAVCCSAFVLIYVRLTRKM